jgi:spore germination protein GerM
VITPSRWSLSTAAAAVAVLLVVTSCGLPGGGSARSVEDDDVPYRLLDRGALSPGTPHDDQLSSVPLVFWLVDDEVLVPAAASVSCDGQPDRIVADLLDELASGPAGDARAAGRATAIPPESGLELVEIRDATAEVEVDPESEVSADRLPVAIGQIVLTVTSAPGVDAVALVSAGESVQVPLPGGALTPGPVTPLDYASLVADRLRDSTPTGSGLVPRLGCP